MLPQEIVRAKRDGRTLGEEEIAFFTRGIADGSIGDGAVAAFAMAVFFNGMDVPERVALTRAMTRSGTVLDWSDLPGPALDKHSTGGVGDTVSLMLAPAVAACGGFVPMISGRGLGHTGGTLDKLESIPGYRTKPDNALFRRVVRKVGAAIIGQTADLAPADGRLYAIRDVTATVESIPLITASILSKKLAAGLSALVMDVKVGSGAFMPTLEQARALAESLATVATDAGLPTRALLTEMDAPLSHAAGNALEVRAAIEYLTGLRREPRMHEIVTELGGEMLTLGGLAGDAEEGARKVGEAIASGAAAERFARMVGALGGPMDLLDRPEAYLARAPVQRPVFPARAGVVAAVDTRAVGLAVVALGGGRTRADQAIDPAVGFAELAERGELVASDRPIAIVHARDEASADAAATRLQAAYGIGMKAPTGRRAVIERIGA